jgi:tetratricopeptide (TPR) repeat protein
MKPADRLNILERGLTLHRAARFADALPLYCEVLAALNLGVAYQQAGNAVDAARAFQAALDIDPLYPKGWFNLGVALENSGRLADRAWRVR